MKKIVLALIFILSLSSFANQSFTKMSINGSTEFTINSYSSDMSRSPAEKEGEFLTYSNIWVSAYLNEDLLTFLEIAASDKKAEKINFKLYSDGVVRYEVELQNASITSYTESLSTYDLSPLVSLNLTYEKKLSKLYKNGKLLKESIIDLSIKKENNKQKEE